MHKLFKAVSPLTLALGLLMVCGVAHADKNALTITVNPGWANDNLVQLNGSSPCQIKATGNPDNDLTVTLTSSNTQINISSTTFTVPKNGNSVPFTIYGMQQSGSPNDTTIKASVTLPDGTQKQEASVPVTVWQQLDAHVSVTPLSAYNYSYDPFSKGYILKATSAAVKMLATHPILPTGLDRTSPPFQNLGVAVVQNLTTSVDTYTFTHPSTTVTGVPQQPFSKSITLTYTIPRATDFDENFTGPLYDGPLGYSDICMGSYSTSDNPSNPQLPPLLVAFMSNGTQVGTVNYLNTGLGTSDSFITYVADYNYASKNTTLRREIGWNLSVNWDTTSTSNATNQTASIPNSNDQAVTPGYILTIPSSSAANSLVAAATPTRSYSGTVMLP